jgi:2-polyprenyl-6-methoxyphenol hydroxylase-like FAD-dependent oxidoreductase
MNKKSLNIAVVGGGPGGLTLARLLQLQDMQVKIYERDAHEDARPKGATLDLHEESGLAALKAAGLTEEFNKAYRPGADAMRLMDAQGNIRFEDAGGGEPGYFRPEIDRGPLMKLLLESLQPGTVRWNSHFTSMEPAGDGWLMHFQDGSSANADLVIAADGANSRIRPYITDVRPFYSGITVVEGQVADPAARIPQIAGLLNGGKIFALGHSQSLIVSSKGDGSLYFYTGSHLPENRKTAGGVDFSDRESCLRWFRETFGGWAPVWEQLFEAAVLPLVPRPQYCMPTDQSWISKPNLSIIGDAAHLMPPYAGEGVNMAMLDALELSEALKAHAQPAKAIAGYETAMRARAGEVAQMTLDNTAMMHAPGALEKMVAMFSNPDAANS